MGYDVNQFKDKGDYIEVITKNGDLVLFDKADEKFAKEHNWYVNQDYAHTNTIQDGIRMPISAHKLLYNPGKDNKVIFKNGNKLDLRRNNIVIAERRKDTSKMRIRCKRVDCVYHIYGMCQADEVAVDKYGRCDTV